MLVFELRAAELATILQAELFGDESILVSRFQKIEDAINGDLSFLASSKFEKFLDTTTASVIIVGANQAVPTVEGRCYLRTNDPHRAFVQLIHHVESIQASNTHSGIHTSAVVSQTATIASTASIGAQVVIGEHCSIGEGSVLMAHVVLGANVSIGSNCLLYPGVTVYQDCVIADHCILHANAVIGSDGFGYLENKDGSFDKIPQIGNVVIESNVEIGSGSCIDRAALGSTVIRQGVKIDNLVHIAHNAEIGANTAIAALSGIAGGTRIGERNRLAGQVGIVGYVQTVADVIVGAQSGVSKNLTAPGVYSGSPAVEIKQRLKQEAAIRRLVQS